MIPLTNWWPLTPRQDTILLLYADGLTSPDIAAELGVSRETVKWHSYRLRLRLEARTIAHAVALAYQHGHLRAAA